MKQNFFSVISDEVQDVASIEQITVVHHEGESYVVKESFAGLRSNIEK